MACLLQHIYKLAYIIYKTVHIIFRERFYLAFFSFLFVDIRDEIFYIWEHENVFMFLKLLCIPKQITHELTSQKGYRNFLQFVSGK